MNPVTASRCGAEPGGATMPRQFVISTSNPCDLIDGARLPATSTPSAVETASARILPASTWSSNSEMATDVADRVGISRATAQRHLSGLVRAGVVELGLDYGSTGRPRHRYRMAD
jgi:DNA-binding transcriptional ArsR family regulator